jgi:hypothetical protein
VQKGPAHVAIRGVVPIVADAVSAVGNRLSVGQDRLLRATLTTPAATADLVRQALQELTAELTAALAASASQRPRVLVVVPPEDIKDGILEADGLQRALAPATAAAAATRRGLRPTRRAVRWSLSARASPPWRRSCGSGSRGWEGRRRYGNWRSGSEAVGDTPPPFASGSTSGGSW